MKTCEKGLHQYSKDLSRCPECRKIAKKIYRDNHKEQQKELYKVWYEANKSHHRAENKKYKSTNLERVQTLEKNWYEANKEQVKARSSAWRKANPGRRNALFAKYRAAKADATPEWLTEKHLAEMEEFYALAQELAWLNQDGKAFHVDHIVPLRGKDVSGLHVPWNLQLLPWQKNLSKSNKITS
jgi:hypothetical protein